MLYITLSYIFVFMVMTTTLLAAYSLYRNEQKTDK